MHDLIALSILCWIIIITGYVTAVIVRAGDDPGKSWLQYPKWMLPGIIFINLFARLVIGLALVAAVVLLLIPVYFLIH